MSVSEPVPPQTASAPADPPAVSPRAAGGWVAWLGVALSLGALAWGFSVSQQLGKTREELARRSTDLLAEVVAARNMATQSESVSKDLAARLGVAEIRLSEVSLQRAQLEALMLSVSRSRDDSLVEDIESSLRLALEQSQLTGSVQPVISALQGAEQRIERAAQPRLNPVQRAIVRDIERLRAAEQVDVPALLRRIDDVLRGVDQWRLRNAPLLIESAVAPAAPAAEATAPPEGTTPATSGDATQADGAADTPPEAPPFWTAQWQAFNGWRADVGARWWAQFRQSTADLVRVSRIDQPEAALLAPEQSYLLRENIKLKLLNVRLGLLARQIDTARADVVATRQLVQRYFDDSDPATRQALQTLDQLGRDVRQGPLPRPDETLGALTVAASGR